MPGMQICAGRAQHGYWRGKGYPASTDSLALSLRSCPETKVIAAGAAQAIVGVAFALSDRRRSCHGAWSLRRKRPVKGLPPDFEKGSNLLPVLALVDQLPGVANCATSCCKIAAFQIASAASMAASSWSPIAVISASIG